MSDEIKQIKLERLADLPRADYLAFSGGDAESAVNAYRAYTGKLPSLIFIWHNRLSVLYYMPLIEVSV